MDKLLPTKLVAQKLRLETPALIAHVIRGHVPPPRVRLGMAYMWSKAEIAAARAELSKPGRRKIRKSVLA